MALEIYDITILAADEGSGIEGGAVVYGFGVAGEEKVGTAAPVEHDSPLASSDDR
ncbi:hypothetical protein [Microbacterium sp. NPDC077057]|uniref:hypothetical protein n=1 Tax=unclassified Microbacterium TaxID=2609290 RepID=UPI00343EB3F6